jgi:hypothetical protein
MAQDAHRNCSPRRTSDSRSQRSHTTSASSADTSALNAAHVVHRTSLPFRTLAVPPQRSQRTSRPPVDVDRGFGCIVRSFARAADPNASLGRTRDRSSVVRPGQDHPGRSTGRASRERPDEGTMGYRDHEGSWMGGSGLTCDPSLGSSCMSDDLHESRLCASNQPRSASTGQSPGRARSFATGRSFGRTRRSARTVLVRLVVDVRAAPGCGRGADSEGSSSLSS